MNLTDIQDPSFLKKLSIKEMQELADQIREFLIQSVSKTGGHLSSNLGVVELTIALHYVFNSPKDKIFFDVGHQCYTHKILTGRAEFFPTLRQYNGISGFQKRSESIHDVWEAGHSSTSLSGALGMAVARDLDKGDYQIIPVIGDGALSSGMALEALNQIGSEKRRMIIVFNDNNMSISRNVGALSHGFSRLRSSKSYNNVKKSIRSSLRKNDIGEAIYTGIHNIKQALKNTVIDGGVFEELDLNYIGPIDGHNIEEMVQAFEAVKDNDEPCVVHVITKKGKGYLPCENDRDGKWHGVGPFNIETGKMLQGIPENHEKWASIINSTLTELADVDPDIIAITPAMIKGSGLQSFFAKYPERSFDCGIAEEHAATFAAGLAISGKKPYLTLYSSFLQRAYDQINHDICRMELPVVIGVDHAGLVGEDGETHHGIFDYGILSGIPNIIITQPSDQNEARNLLYTGFQMGCPFVIRYSKGYTRILPKEEFKLLEIGKWEMLNDDSSHKMCILTYGEEVPKILEKVKINKLPVTVVNCRYLRPVDEEMIVELARRNMKMFVYETDLLENGLGTHILEVAQRNGLFVDMTRVGIDNMYVQQGSNRLLRKELGIDINSFLDLVLKELNK